MKGEQQQNFPRVMNRDFSISESRVATPDKIIETRRIIEMEMYNRTIAVELDDYLRGSSDTGKQNIIKNIETVLDAIYTLMSAIKYHKYQSDDIYLFDRFQKYFDVTLLEKLNEIFKDPDMNMLYIECNTLLSQIKKFIHEEIGGDRSFALSMKSLEPTLPRDPRLAQLIQRLKLMGHISKQTPARRCSSSSMGVYEMKGLFSIQILEETINDGELERYLDAEDGEYDTSDMTKLVVAINDRLSDIVMHASTDDEHTKVVVAKSLSVLQKLYDTSARVLGKNQDGVKKLQKSINDLNGYDRMKDTSVSSEIISDQVVQAVQNEISSRKITTAIINNVDISEDFTGSIDNFVVNITQIVQKYNQGVEVDMDILMQVKSYVEHVLDAINDKQKKYAMYKNDFEELKKKLDNVFIFKCIY